MTCTCTYAHQCDDCRREAETPTRRTLPVIDLSALFSPGTPSSQGWGILSCLNSFMPGCTHPGVAQGTTCPLCGRVV